MVSAAILRDRKVFAGIVVGVAALVFLLLWFFNDGFSTSVGDYLNAHGGYALIFLYLAALIVGILAYIFRDHRVLWAFGVILLFALIASFIDMTIAVA